MIPMSSFIYVLVGLLGWICLAGMLTHKAWYPLLKQYQPDRSIESEAYGRFRSEVDCTECGSSTWWLLDRPILDIPFRNTPSTPISHTWRCDGCGAERLHNPLLEVYAIDEGIPDEIATHPAPRSHSTALPSGPPAPHPDLDSLIYEDMQSSSGDRNKKVEEAEPGEPFRADVECGRCGADRWVDVDGFYDDEVPDGVKPKGLEYHRCWGCLGCGRVRESNPIVVEVKVDDRVNRTDVPPGVDTHSTENLV